MHLQFIDNDDDIYMFFNENETPSEAYKCFNRIIDEILEELRPDILKFKNNFSMYTGEEFNRWLSGFVCEIIDVLRMRFGNKISLTQFKLASNMDSTISLCQSTQHQALRSTLNHIKGFNINEFFEMERDDKFINNAYEDFGYRMMYMVSFYIRTLQAKNENLQSKLQTQIFKE